MHYNLSDGSVDFQLHIINVNRVYKYSLLLFSKLLLLKIWKNMNLLKQYWDNFGACIRLAIFRWVYIILFLNQESLLLNIPRYENSHEIFQTHKTRISIIYFEGQWQLLCSIKYPRVKTEFKRKNLKIWIPQKCANIIWATL